MTIDAAGFNASVINLQGGDLCTISSGTSDRVVLRGISFQGANGPPSSPTNHGINVTKATNVYVEHCSLSGCNNIGVFMQNGGNLFVTGTEVRKCGAGISVVGGLIPTTLVAHDSRVTECSEGFSLQATVAVATGLLSNCTASMCSSFGFLAVGGNRSLALTNCRSFGNFRGLEAQTLAAANATISITNCMVTQNSQYARTKTARTKTARTKTAMPSSITSSQMGAGRQDIPMSAGPI